MATLQGAPALVQRYRRSPIIEHSIGGRLWNGHERAWTLIGAAWPRLLSKGTQIWQQDYSLCRRLKLFDWPIPPCHLCIVLLFVPLIIPLLYLFRYRKVPLKLSRDEAISPKYHCEYRQSGQWWWRTATAHSII